MSVKRILIKILPLLFIASIVIFVYSIFNGIPFGNYIAKSKIKNYVKQVYVITEVSTPKYNFLNGTYSANIQKNSNFEITYNLKNNTLYDVRVANEYQKQLDKEYYELQKSYRGNIKLPFSVYVYNVILANGKYSRDFYKLTCFQKMNFSIVNRQKISPADSIKIPAIVTKTVLEKLGNRFNITSLQVGYIDLNGYLEIIVDGKDVLTVKQMQKHTSKLDKIGEKDKELIRKLNK
ncbi:MAG TPA: hypothetical protein VIM70_08840 [Clostridium sp.]|uniref:YfjL-like protein n=1 Tax=Clostridium sp. TaxID=1506 RepID=UPI002F92F6B2